MKNRSDNGRVRVDKNIPIPDRHFGSGKCKYPWHELEVGDSFLLPPDIAKSGNYTVYMNMRHAPKHFIMRDTPEGRRIWRDK